MLSRTSTNNFSRDLDAATLGAITDDCLTDFENAEETDLITETRSFPSPISHGGKVSYTVDDGGKLHDLVDSCAQRAEIEMGQRKTIKRGYTSEYLPTGTYNVILSRSRWKAGAYNDGVYTPYSEYRLYLRRADEEGDTIYEGVVTSLELTITPQDERAVYPDGNSLTFPYGGGVTWLQIASTHVTEQDGYFGRAAGLIDSVFEHELDSSLVIEGSDRIISTEATSRFDRDVYDSVIASAKYSEALIGAETVRTGPYTGVHFKSERWCEIGFENSDYGVMLKVYLTSRSNKDDPLSHPRIEASLVLPSDVSRPTTDEWDDIQNRLRSLVTSHLIWAGVSEDRLVSDDVFNGAEEPNHTWYHPVNGRDALKYSMLNLYGEVYSTLKAQTKSPHDILHVMAHSNRSTYAELATATGLSKRSIRRYARRFENMRICRRYVSGEGHLMFRSRLIRKLVAATLQLGSGDETSDLIARKQERVSKREEKSVSGKNKTKEDENREESNDRSQNDSKEIAIRKSLNVPLITATVTSYKRDSPHSAYT